jgi:two-component system sensor histidine kinase KdpD
VEIQAQLADGQLRLSVADNGPGIPEAWRARVFDKFFRAPPAATGGSGLGLTIVKGFVEAHGGTVSVASRPGGGAQFTLCLPQTEKLPNMDGHD